MPCQSTTTQRSPPTTQASWPGGTIIRSPVPNSSCDPSSITTFIRPETTYPSMAPAFETDLAGTPGHVRCQLHPRADAELGEDVGEVGLHGAAGDEEARSDLGVGEPLGGEPYHLALGGGQALPAVRGAGM